ncbi:MAG: hypothetical protein E7K04_03655 [Helicobacter sp.]|nr:hypothetical protein [Helicobacter sp.]
MPHFKSSLLDLKDSALDFSANDFSFEIFYAPKDSEIYASKIQAQILVKHAKNAFLIQVIKDKNNLIFKSEKSTKPIFSGILKQALMLLKANILKHHPNVHFEVDNLGQSDAQKTKIYDSQFLLDFSALSELRDFTLEIGFGSGRNLLKLACENKDKLFLGLEIHLPSIAQVLKQIELLGLSNLYILHSDCRRALPFLASKSCQKAILHFPIPCHKTPSKRVLTKDVLAQIMRILQDFGQFHLRTDDFLYFYQSLELAENLSLDFSAHKNAKHSIVSKYEARWIAQSRNIFDLFITNTLNKKEPLNESFSAPDIQMSASTNMRPKDLIKLQGRKIIDFGAFLQIKHCFLSGSGALFGAILGINGNFSFHFLHLDNHGLIQYINHPFGDQIGFIAKILDKHHEK